MPARPFSHALLNLTLVWSGAFRLEAHVDRDRVRAGEASPGRAQPPSAILLTIECDELRSWPLWSRRFAPRSIRSLIHL